MQVAGGLEDLGPDVHLCKSSIRIQKQINIVGEWDDKETAKQIETDTLWQRNADIIDVSDYLAELIDEMNALTRIQASFLIHNTIEKSGRSLFARTIP
ncbi:hypothetical protein CHS0354_008447 [Potamilus streckersoni]|uniref:Uncharacterized protein n=1 Tax=Potamilus streckersoni TaxID=2493646 RepID=A0AAE0VGR6_9BIVA|nr:hypothetical protein CHS0354_008447 [Potamilus streckersoni]